MPDLAAEVVLPSDRLPDSSTDKWLVTLPSDEPAALPIDFTGATEPVPSSPEELAAQNAKTSLGAAAVIRKGITDQIMSQAILPTDREHAARLVSDIFAQPGPTPGLAGQVGIATAAPFNYLGRAAKGLVGDVAVGMRDENPPGNPFPNFTQAVTSPTDFKTPLPIDEKLALARQDEAEHGGLPWRSTLASVSTGLAEAAPKIAAISLAPASLPFQMAGSGLLFGLDNEGNFNLKEAGLMALLPGVGAGARAAVGKSIAKGMEAGIVGLDKPIVQRALLLGGDQMAMDAYMLAMQTPELAELKARDPARFWEMVGTTIGQNAAFAGLHVFKADPNSPESRVSSLKSKTAEGADETLVERQPPVPASSSLESEVRGQRSEVSESQADVEPMTRLQAQLDAARTGAIGGEAAAAPIGSPIATHPGPVTAEEVQQAHEELSIANQLERIRRQQADEAEANRLRNEQDLAAKRARGEEPEQPAEIPAIVPLGAPAPVHNLAAQRKQDEDVALFPDGSVDPIQTSINRMRRTASDSTPATKGDVQDLAGAVADLQAALRNPFKAAEVTPGSPAELPAPDIANRQEPIAEPEITPPSDQAPVEKTRPGASGSEVLEPEGAKPATPRKKRSSFFIRARSDGVPDILDDIQDLGGIKPPGETAGGEYDGYKAAAQGQARLLFLRSAKHGPDTIIGELHSLGGTGNGDGRAWQKIQTPDDLWDAIKSAVRDREKLKQNGGGAGAQQDSFWSAASRPENMAQVERVRVDQLNVGMRFRLKAPGASHEEMTVTHVDADTGEVTVKDGPKFGVQDLPPGAEIYVKKGTLVSGPYAKYAAGEYSLERPETVEEQKARLRREKQESEIGNQKSQMLDRAGRRLTGQDLDTTGEMFGAAPETRTDKAGQGSLFSAGGLTGEESQQSIRKAIDEKHERINRAAGPGANEGRGLDDLLTRAKSAFRRLLGQDPQIYGDATHDPGYAETEHGRRLQTVARAHGAEVVFFKGDRFAPRGVFSDGRIFLNSSLGEEGINHIFEHELAHSQYSQNARLQDLRRLLDLGSPEAKVYRQIYDGWLQSKGKPPLDAHTAAEEIVSDFVCGQEFIKGLPLRRAFIDPQAATRLAREYHGDYSETRGAAAAPADRAEQLRLFAKGDEARPKARLLDVRRGNDEISVDAAREFASWPERARAADGSEILLKNPENTSIGKRVKHLIWDNTTDRLDKAKAAWIPNVPHTLKTADVRLRDAETGNRIYVRTYDDGTRHMVVVRPDGVVEDQKPFTGKLITQFPFEEHGRQSEFEVEWRNGSGQSQGTPAPASKGSSRLDARQSVSDGVTPPPPKGGKETLPPGEDGVKRDSRFAASEYLPSEDEARPEHERGVDQVKGTVGQIKAALAEADAELHRTNAAWVNDERSSGQTRAELNNARHIAAARYRLVRDELLQHPDYVAEQLAKHHAALTEANELLKPHGLSIRPEEFPNVDQIAGVLSPEQFDRYRKLAADVEASHDELARMPKKMISRVYAEMQADGRLPKSAPLNPDAGRSLDTVTDWLRSHGVDSPKLGLVERLNLGGRVADAWNDTKTSLQKTWLSAQGLWRAGVESYKAPPLDGDFRHVIKSWIYADQRTGLETHRFVKELVAKVSSSDRRKAMAVWLDANGDAGMLRMQADSVPDAYRRVWQAALKLTPDEKALALKIKADFEAKLEDGLNVGLLEAGREDYGVPQRWKIAPEVPPTGDAKHGSAGRPSAKLDPRSPFFSFARQTPSYFDGILAGGVPENLDIAHLVAVYDAAFHKSLSSRGMIAALQNAIARDGLPVVKISGSASSQNAKEGGKAYFVDSRAWNRSDVSVDGRPYRSLDHSALKGWKIAFKDTAGNPIIVKGDMLIHPDHFDYLKNELGQSALREGIAGKVFRPVLQSQAFLKASKLSASVFHLATIGEHMASHLVNPFLNGFELDLRQPDQSLLVRHGMELGMGDSRMAYEEGLASGHSGLFNKIPGLGDLSAKMTDWMFKDYIPSIMMKAGLQALEHNRARYSKATWEGKALTPDQIAELTAQQMNAAGGLMNYRMRGAEGNFWGQLGANKTMMDFQRMALLAPQFLEARARVVGQALKPYGHEQRKMLFVQAATLYVGARVLNLLLDDDPHWLDNPFSVVHKGRAYSIRTIVGDFWHMMTAPASFLAGRLSPFSRMGIEGVTGRDLRTGARKEPPIQTNFGPSRFAQNLVVDLARWLTPIPVEGMLPGAGGREQTAAGMAMASVGVGSRKYDASTQMRDLATAFNRNSPDAATRNYQLNREGGAWGTSPYRKLDSMLDAGDLAGARREVEGLQAEGKTEKQIASRYDRNTYFTGSAAREETFKATLSDRQKQIYQQALDAKKSRAATLEKAMAE